MELEQKPKVLKISAYLLKKKIEAMSPINKWKHLNYAKRYRSLTFHEEKWLREYKR